MHNITEIEKEKVNNLVFPNSDVLMDAQVKLERSWALHKATALGNLEKQKVIIVFEDSLGIKKVNTTIWAITEQNIILKEGRTIPIHRVHSVHSV